MAGASSPVDGTDDDGGSLRHVRWARACPGRSRRA
jgi:hypothetical protein